MALAMPALGESSRIPTNLSVLEEAVRKAVYRGLEDSLGGHFPMVLLTSEGTHDACDLVEDVLLEELTRRGIQVRRRGIPDSVRQEGSVFASVDSVSALVDSVSASGGPPSVAISDGPGMVLSYRIRYVGVEYIGHRRRRIWGEKWETRLARAELAFQLVDRSDGRVVAFQEVKGQVQDQFPHRLLDYVESSRYTFARSTLDTQSWMRFLEPVIVSAVVGGLIYLFYSNR